MMLVLIGSRWLDASDDAGRMLLSQDGDWVRTESRRYRRGKPASPGPARRFDHAAGPHAPSR
jgi:hypothetical protein